MTTAQTSGLVQGGVAPGHRRRLAFAFMGRYGTLLGMMLMVVVFSVAAPDAFPTLSNFANILNQAALTAIDIICDAVLRWLAPFKANQDDAPPPHAATADSRADDMHR